MNFILIILWSLQGRTHGFELFRKPKELSYNTILGYSMIHLEKIRPAQECGPLVVSLWACQPFLLIRRCTLSVSDLRVHLWGPISTSGIQQPVGQYQWDRLFLRQSEPELPRLLISMVYQDFCSSVWSHRYSLASCLLNIMNPFVLDRLTRKHLSLRRDDHFLYQ